MIRILQCVNIMDRAGLETMLMNYYRNIDRSKVQFDFLVHRPYRGAYDDEIEALGGKIYHAPRLYPQNYSRYFKWMKEFFEEHPEYSIVHSHIDAMSFFPLLAAKKAGIPVRISHSHSSKLDRDFKLPIKWFALKKVPKVANYYMACGDMAGKFMYENRKFTIVRNAIDLDRFSYSEDVRVKLRDELGLENKIVIGHVGRFCYIKNQLFLLDILSKLNEEKDDFHLVLVGKGEDEDKIRERIVEKKLSKQVTILTDRSDVNELYNMMDVFVMPSLFEGLPVVGVEAQANGLPCVMSESISKEILLTSCIEQVSLNEEIDKWSKTVFLKSHQCRNENALQELCGAGYDIKEEACRLQDIYVSLIRGDY